VNDADAYFEKNPSHSFQAQSDTPIVERVLIAEEIQIQTMIVDNQADQHHRSQRDNQFDEPTRLCIAVVLTGEVQLIFDDHQHNAQDADHTRHVADQRSERGEKASDGHK
jgi:hypothetical protein